MFAAAFFGMVTFCLTMMARFGATVPESVLAAGWRISGVALLSAGLAMAETIAAGSPGALVSMGMMTAGVRLVQV